MLLCSLWFTLSLELFLKLHTVLSMPVAAKDGTELQSHLVCKHHHSLQLVFNKDNYQSQDELELHFRQNLMIQCVFMCVCVCWKYYRNVNLTAAKCCEIQLLFCLQNFEITPGIY